MVIPTLSQLRAQIVSRIESELNITIPSFGVSYLRAFANVQAGMTWTLFMAIAKVQKNIFVDTCDNDTLARFGQVKLGRDRYPAIQAVYKVKAIGDLGANIPQGITFRANDSALSPSARFILDIPYTLDGTNEFDIRALVAGNGSRLNIGDRLTVESPIGLVEDVFTVVSETTQPQDAESFDDYRNAIIQSYQLEPNGGSSADYRLWSMEVQGISNAYPFAKAAGSSEVNLFIEANTANGVPSGTDLQNVEDNIELPTVDRPARKPITAIVNYLPVTPLDIDIEIANFQDLQPENQTAIFSAIKMVLDKTRPFVGAIDVLAKKNDIFDVNKIISTVNSVVPGSSFGTVTMRVNGTITTSHTFTNGDIPYLNSIAYV